MSIETWLAFVAACTIMTLIPGPSVLLVVGQALNSGRRAAFLCIAGDILGGIVLMGFSVIGVGAILATSAVLFLAVKWAGVTYLAYLGIRQIHKARRGDLFSGDLQSSNLGWSSFWSGVITAILNPKAIIFYMAFLAQFIDPARDLSFQIAVLLTTSTILVALLLAGYALVAERARHIFQSASARKRIGYTGGGFMLGGSVLMAAAR